jgi:hypothetical protein
MHPVFLDEATSEAGMRPGGRFHFGNNMVGFFFII